MVNKVIWRGIFIPDLLEIIKINPNLVNGVIHFYENGKLIHLLRSLLNQKFLGYGKYHQAVLWEVPYSCWL